MQNLNIAQHYSTPALNLCRQPPPPPFSLPCMICPPPLPSPVHPPHSSILFRCRFPGTPSTALTAVQSLQDRRSGSQAAHPASNNCSSTGGVERGRTFHEWSCFLYHQLGLMPCALPLGGHTSTYQVGTCARTEAISCSESTTYQHIMCHYSGWIFHI